MQNLRNKGMMYEIHITKIDGTATKEAFTAVNDKKAILRIASTLQRHTSTIANQHGQSSIPRTFKNAGERDLSEDGFPATLIKPRSCPDSEKILPSLNVAILVCVDSMKTEPKLT